RAGASRTRGAACRPTRPPAAAAPAYRDRQQGAPSRAGRGGGCARDAVQRPPAGRACPRPPRDGTPPTVPGGMKPRARSALNPRIPPMRASLCFVLAALAPTFAPTVSPAQQPLTARDVVERIKQNIGVPWTEPTVDTFKDGDPATPVTGIAVTMMATFDVLQRAAARGANLVITHEPTFYDHFDKLDVLEAEHDSVTAAKRAFIRERRMVVVRMHDHWHRRRPEPMATDLARVLGWHRNRAESERLHRLPETTLAELALTIRPRLPAPTLRVVGDSALRVT